MSKRPLSAPLKGVEPCTPDSGQKRTRIATKTSATMTELRVPPDQNLCPRCEAVDFEAVMRNSRRGPLMKRVSVLGKWDGPWTTSNCSFCKLLVAIRPNHQPSEEDLVLSGLRRGNRVRKELTCVNPHQESIMLAVHSRNISQHDMPEHLRSTGFIYGYSSVSDGSAPLSISGIRHLGPDAIEWCALKQWLQTCSESHLGNCRLTRIAHVQFMTVIDCERRKLVLAPEKCDYIALSYIWGSEPFVARDLEINESLPDDLPRTIEDSMNVAEKLGVPYIWIDRYCIPQNNGQVKHGLIGQMDRIYRNAYATIIAAAGNDPRYGLPGVSSSRVSHPKTTISGWKLLLSLRDPRASIAESVWMTRAWTYQEAVLSRRRIFFTDEQVYFECGEMCCSEVFLSQIDTKAKFKPYLKWHENQRLFPSNAVGHWPWDIVDRINEYTQRKLSYPDDILKGAMGFLRAFEDFQHSVKHFWGIPILTSVSEVNELRVYSLRSSKDGFITGLFSFAIVPSMRRPGFPSWSWVGWHGGTIDSWDHKMKWKNKQSSTRTTYDITLWVEMQSGEKVAWRQFHETFIQAQTRPIYSPILHVAARTIPVYLQSFSSHSIWEEMSWGPHQRTLQGVFADFQINECYTHYQKVYLHDVLVQEEADSTSVEATGILFEDLGYLKQEIQLPVLLVRNNECIGTMYIGGGDGDGYWSCLADEADELKTDELTTEEPKKGWKYCESFEKKFTWQTLRLS